MTITNMMHLFLLLFLDHAVWKRITHPIKRKFQLPFLLQTSGTVCERIVQNIICCPLKNDMTYQFNEYHMQEKLTIFLDKLNHL